MREGRQKSDYRKDRYGTSMKNTNIYKYQIHILITAKNSTARCLFSKGRRAALRNSLWSCCRTLCTWIRGTWTRGSLSKAGRGSLSKAGQSRRPFFLFPGDGIHQTRPRLLARKADAENRYQNMNMTHNVRQYCSTTTEPVRFLFLYRMR